MWRANGSPARLTPGIARTPPSHPPSPSGAGGVDRLRASPSPGRRDSHARSCSYHLILGVGPHRLRGERRPVRDHSPAVGAICAWDVRTIVTDPDPPTNLW